MPHTHGLDELAERRRRRWLQAQYARLFFAIGCVLLVSSWLTILPPLWWSPRQAVGITRGVAMETTLWMLLAQWMALRWAWRMLSPQWRRE